MLAFTANANAFRVVAAVTEGRGTTGTDPFVAAGMTLALFFQSLLQGFQQLVQSAQCLDLCLFLVTELLQEITVQPV